MAGGVTGGKELIKKVRAIRSAFGSQLDPHSCWMITRSMETVVLRMKQAARTAGKVAQWLAGNPHEPVRIYHPELIADAAYQDVYKRQCSGAGSTFAFVLDGGRAKAFRFINALRLFVGGEPGRHRIAGLPSGLDHALGRAGGRARRGRRVRRADPRLHRPGA